MDAQEMIKLYNEGKSLRFLGDKYGIDPRTIKNTLIAKGIKIRTRSEQNILTNQARAKKVNHNYFDNIDTYQKAWILGFFAADGTINSKRNSLKIGLSSVDREILEKIKEEINIERNILDYETGKGGYLVSELTWTSGNQKEKLASYNIVPNKTYKHMHMPKLSSRDLELIYLLGYYDGDGCFKNDGSTCRIEICSYSPEILQDFSNLINDSFLIKKEVYKNIRNKNSVLYTLTYSTKDAITILDYLYNLMNINNCFYLKRKFDKYQLWQKQNNRI